MGYFISYGLSKLKKIVCANTYEIVYEVNNLLFVRFLLGNALVEYKNLTFQV